LQVHSRYVSVDGIRTHYLEAGDGRPVVLLHSANRLLMDFFARQDKEVAAT
jgi:pimeloyl-ACP methyl ester carboxylesterase